MNTHCWCSTNQTYEMQKNNINIWQLSWFIFLMLLSYSTRVEAQMYKWADKSGVIHFGQAPPQDVKGAARMEASLPARNSISEFDHPQGKPEKTQPGERKLQERAERTPAANQQVAAEMYSTSWCGYCRKAREYFRARGIPLIEYDIEADPDAADRKRQIDTRPGVPLVVINGQLIHGYAPAMYEQALASRR